jgi:predicted hydrocarbon binding protein
MEQESNPSNVQMMTDKIPTDHMEVQGELCKLFYKRWGKDALPIIKNVFFEFGKHIGRRIKDECRTDDFKILCFSYLAPAMKRSKEAKLLDVEENLMRIRTSVCPWSLENTSRELCEAMMEMDRGILDTISNGKFKSELTKTTAAGDEYCEAIIRKTVD